MEKEKKIYFHKEHFCIFCKCKFTRIQQHFTRKHKEEDKVQEIIKTENIKERRWLWKKLRQEGDHLYNIKDYKKSGTRIIVKEPTVQNKNKKYFDCASCHGRIRTTSRNIHMKLCVKNLNKDQAQVQKTETDIYDGLPETIINWIRSSLYINKYLQHTMEEKQNKQIFRTIITDLIDLEQNVRQQSNEKKPLCCYFKTSFVDQFISAIKIICQEQIIEGKKVIRYPFRAQRLCRLISDLNEFLIIYYSKKNDDNKINQLKKFSSVFCSETKKLIKKNSYISIRLKKFQKPVQLPKTSDINKLIVLLKKETPELVNKLEEKKDSTAWRSLAENILLRLTIYNRRRGGAVEKMRISEYEATQVSLKTTTEESRFNLKEEEKEFLKEVKIVEILHKCNNAVPIYISKELQEAMNCLKMHREFGNINKDNEFFFAASKQSLKPISGVKVMSKYRRFLPDNIRHLFTATNLRKHGATVAQILKFSKQDKEEWAMHMGHSLNVHNRYYKKPEEVNAILKTGRILDAMDKGVLKYYKGRKISELPLSYKEGSPSKSNSNSDNNKIVETSFMTEQLKSAKREGIITKRKGKCLKRKAEALKTKDDFSTPCKRTEGKSLKAQGSYSCPDYLGLKRGKFCERNSDYSVPRTFSKVSSKLRKFKYNKSSSEDETSEEENNFRVRKALDFNDRKVIDDEESERSIASGKYTSAYFKENSTCPRTWRYSRAYRKYKPISNSFSVAYKRDSSEFSSGSSEESDSDF